MPNPYLYATVALSILLVVVGVWLGFNNAHLRGLVTSLQLKYSSLEVNYTKLQEINNNLSNLITSIQDNYTRLQGEYHLLIENYSGLKVKYESLNGSYLRLQSMFNELNANYTLLSSEYNSLSIKYSSLNKSYSNLINALSAKVIIKPVLYSTPQLNGVYGFALYVNVTNLSDETVLIIGMGNKYYGGNYYWYQWIPVPPNSTVVIPFAQTLDTEEHPHVSDGNPSNVLHLIYPMEEYMFYDSASNPLNIMGSNVTAYIMFSNSLLSRLGVEYVVEPVSAVVSTTAALKQTVMAAAVYFPGASFFGLSIVYYNSTRVGIYGYSIYAGNGTLLATCNLSTPLTLHSISVNAFNILPTSSGPFTTKFNEFSISEFGLEIIPSTLNDAVTCTPTKFIFPYPFNGYIILETNVSNIVVLLVPA